MIAGDVITEAQLVYLNDSAGANFPSTVLLPILAKACRDLETELQSNGVSELKELTSALTVPINSPTLNGVSGFPADVLSPIELLERQAGGSIDQYTPMRQLTWEPTIIADSTIKYWDYREGEIKLNLATAVREVLLRYVKAFIVITSVNTVIPIVQAQGYLSARTAAIAALTIGENPSRASICQDEANVRMIKLLNIMVKRSQSLPVRRKRFNPFKRI